MKYFKYYLFALLMVVSVFDGLRDVTMFKGSVIKEKGLDKSWWITPLCAEGGSWRNKYAQDKAGRLIPYEGEAWYYLGLITPNYREKFPGSTTLFVGFTDGFHFFKMLQLWLFCITFSLIAASDYKSKPILDALDRLKLVEGNPVRHNWFVRHPFWVYLALSRLSMWIGFYILYNVIFR